MSFKQGHVSIHKRCIFLPLFLLCAYDSSVLQNFKIFTHLLPNLSYKDPRLTEVTYHCITFKDRVRTIPIKCLWCMSLMKLCLKLLLFVVYATDEGILKIITVRVVCHWWRLTKDYYCSCCMSLMKIYLRLLLFLVYITDEGLAKIIIFRDICFRWQLWWKRWKRVCLWSA